MRAALQFVYAAIVIAVMAVLARTCFGVRTTEVSKQVAQRVARGAEIVRAAPPDAMRPADAGRYTSRPLPAQLLANDSLTKALFDELSARYKPALADFKRAAEGAGAQLVVVSFGVDGGRHMSELERSEAEPVRQEACRALQVPCYDFSPALDSALDAGVQVVVDPKAGHLSRAGAVIVAAQMARIVDSYSAYRNTSTFNADERPPTFGDARPLENDVVDLGDGHPVSAQGEFAGTANGLRPPISERNSEFS